MQYAPLIARKKPTVVEAWQWDGRDETAALITDWVETHGGFAAKHPHEDFIILGRDVNAVKLNDWVVRDQFNDFYPLPHNVFMAVYETSAAL